jgi:two-component system cell cycle sensor histidine kinase/response regulator CckA
VLSIRDGSRPQNDVQAVALRAMNAGGREIAGPLFDERGLPILVFSFPIQSSGAADPPSNQKYCGAVLLTVDPAKFLFPLIAVDPMSTRTGEYMLVAKGQNGIQILSPLRHPPTPALTVRMKPEQAPPLLHVSVDKESASGEFIDFRGVPVIAVARHISGSVGLVRQINQSEAYAAYYTQARTELLLAIAILSAAVLAFLAFQRAQRVSRLREVAASEARLSGIINAAMDSFVALDSDLRIALFNRAAQQMFRCRAEEVLGQSGLQLLPERYREEIRRRIDSFAASRESARAIPDSAHIWGLRRNGEEFPMEASVSKLDVGGQRLFLAIIRDITERQQAQQLLKSTEEKYRRLFEESREVIFISSAEGKFLDINPAGLELFGFDSREELLQVDIARTLYLNPEEREEIRRAQETRGYVKDYEIALRRKDGHKRIVLETSNAVRDENGRIVAYRGILRDITERKSLERQLLQSQKMEAVGQLAGGIAHDFNNILTAILGYAELLQSSLPPGDRHLRDVGEIARAASRAASLTRQLLAFSRRQVMQPRVIGLNTLVADMNKMLRRLITENIELVTSMDPALGYVRADPAQIEQVILNLVVNAKDAMPEGGKLTIQTENADLAESLPAQPLDVPAGRYVMVAVSDTGHGMDPEVQGRIFEPFFTTKEIGKGTGLGLSTVYGIVKQSGGYIIVQSDIGDGTAFRVFMPRCETGEPVVEASGESLRDLEGSETILLAEDEASVRILARDVLLRHKYKVHEAENGEHAIAIARSIAAPIHLMVTDIVMPQMGGRDLARRLSSIHPETRVLFISGYADVELGKNADLIPGKTFLPKPFSPLDLVRLVRELLDEDITAPLKS